MRAGYVNQDEVRKYAPRAVRERQAAAAAAAGETSSSSSSSSMTSAQRVSSGRGGAAVAGAASVRDFTRPCHSFARLDGRSTEVVYRSLHVVRVVRLQKPTDIECDERSP